MDEPADSRGTERRATSAEARLGAVTSLCCFVLLVATLPLVALPSRSVIELLTWAAGALGAVVVLVVTLPWPRLPRPTLLVLPGLLVAGLAGAGVMIGALDSTWVGFITVAIVYVGLTQTRRTVTACIPVALAGWLLCYHSITGQVLARLPISVGIWLLLGLLLADQGRRARDGLSALHRLADLDQLTGLGNRRALERRLTTVRPGDAVVLLDLDHFKRINDEQGHAAGDRVLADLGSALRAVARGEDAVFRYGGEEMLVLLPTATGRGAEQFLRRFASAWQVLRPEVTFSAGAAVHPGGALDATVGRADAALYRAKAAGRDRIAIEDEPPSPLRPVAASTGEPPVVLDLAP